MDKANQTPAPSLASSPLARSDYAASEAFDMAIVKREEARRHPDWILPVSDPRRRRAQRRFDAACEAVHQAQGRLGHSNSPPVK